MLSFTYLKPLNYKAWATTTLGAIVALTALVNPIYAQSIDRDNPTRLTSNEVRGKIDEDPIEYFYSFVAQPGEIVVTLDVRSNDRCNQVEVDLFNSDAKKMLGNRVNACGTNKSERKVERLQVSRQQPIIMRIYSQPINTRTGGTYLVRVDGAVQHK